MTRPKGEGKPGRGCCAQCFSPTMCALPICGCHIPQGAVCRATGCGVGLYITIPSELTVSEQELRARRYLQSRYGYDFTKGAAA